jgi:hypothetical protein
MMRVVREGYRRDDREKELAVHKFSQMSLSHSNFTEVQA